MIERAVILCQSDSLTKDDLTGISSNASKSGSRGKMIPLAQMEKEHIKFCLDQLNWNMGECSEKLGIHRNTLRSKIKEYNLKQS